MKNTIQRLLAGAFAILLCQTAPAQSDPGCTPGSGGDTDLMGEAFFNYGSLSGAFNSKYQLNMTVGQMVTGDYFSPAYKGTLGFWGRFLMPPAKPVVTATQGDLADRIQISWAVNPFSPAASDFKIYRNGVFLALVDKNTRNYNDFNVIAGTNYTYAVRGVNAYGEGSPGTALGFQVPNGVVTGWVRTVNGGAVPNALVSLNPMQGFSLKIGQFDGALAKADSGTSLNLLPTVAATNWTLAFWIKTTSVSGTPTMLKISPNLVVQPSLSGVSITAGGANLSGSFSGATGNWHHVALTFGSGQYRLYLDGALAALTNGAAVLASPELYLGTKTGGTGAWNGYLDELRIYHRRLDELDLPDAMNGTASSLTPDLKYYWKMDEGEGTKSFDIVRRNRLFLCGPIFNTDRPNVHTSGVTNSDGYYRIESANYGTGTTFLASPAKNFYKHRALKFIRAEGDYALLPDFAVTPKSTFELWVYSTEPAATMTLLNKFWANGSQSFNLAVVNGEVQMAFNGGALQTLGTLGIGYHHLAFTINNTGTANQVAFYKDGILAGSFNFGATTGDWSQPGQQWAVGASRSYGQNNFGSFFGGLIDEIAVYDTTLAAAKILNHAQNSRDPQERGLRIYFPFDEGTGAKLTNVGSNLLTETGLTVGTEWTILAPNQSTAPHVFSPTTRQVTLNPSITSVDQVDFIDRSTVAVSGFVRYQNTDCFAKEVEILVNGLPFNPPILTDSTGKFTIDFEPGATATLSPSFKNHVFSPASVDVVNVISPQAGIVFNDLTTRTARGQVAGGDCKRSIIQNPGTPQGTVCTVKVRSLDGCFEKILTLNNELGNYQFTLLPPIKMTVAVVEHSDPKIKTAFQSLGGIQVDLTEKDTLLDFIYHAPPEVYFENGLDPVSLACPTIVLAQGDSAKVDIKMREVYVGGVCVLDTANLKIINGFAGIVEKKYIKNGMYRYKFKVGSPNPTPPYLQVFEVVGTTVLGDDASKVVQGVVTGLRSKANTFTTQLPARPQIILRDPPGDHSSAFIEKGEKFCQKVVAEFEDEEGFSIGTEVDGSSSTIVIVAPLGLGLGYPNEGGPLASVEGEFTFKKISENSFETCTSFTERLSTSDDDLIVGGGQGADIFMGAGLNVEFGFGDRVRFNDTICEPVLDVVVSVSPKNFGTTYVYSEFHIRNVVMKYLLDIANDPATSPGKRDTCLASYADWDTILMDNNKLKSLAKFRRNLSFDALTEFEYSELSSTDTTSANGNFQTDENVNGLDFEFEVAGVGVTAGGTFFFSKTKGETKEDGTETEFETGFTLKDDDVLDAFSVDVAMDSVYNTPVFRTKSGQSSCPWEPNTAKREGVLLTSVDGTVRTDVPSNEPAVFKFTLGNTSETNETFTYAVVAPPSNNKDGAKIYLNSTPLDKPVPLQIPYGTSLPVTITVERGPVEYDYEKLKIALISECEEERAWALGLLPEDNQGLYSYHYIDVHFIKPCTEVDINVPEQDWVLFPDPLTPGPDDVRRVTVSNYDLTNTDFKLVRLQFRRSDGDGAWINIPGISEMYNPNWAGFDALPNPKPPTLGQTFSQYFWDTNGLGDGPYEIRAVASCTGDVADKPGISHIIKGKIERQPPSLLGVPQPSDGVYHVGDEVSFTFNKAVDCSKINAVDNVKLIDAADNLPIDIDITCHDNQIFLDPNFQNEFFENHILHAELHDIQDLTGNKLVFERWEFYVDRNELAWLTDSLGMTKFEDETKTATASIHNRGGYPVPFDFQDLPAWVHVVPNQGTLAPNEIRPIYFTVDSNLTRGLWRDSLTMHTITGQNPFFMGGDEGLPFGVRVICRPPNWGMNPQLFANSMNMVVRLNIENGFSDDVEDMVVAFIGDTLVGRAHLEFVPQINQWLAYLTVYGNPNHVLQPIRLEIWDASTCLRYLAVEQDFTFQPDVVVGIPSAPQILHTNGKVLRDVPFGFGWNWFSFNLGFANPSPDSVLASLDFPENDLLKAQNAFATYLNGAGWFGSLTTLGNNSMYIYRADHADTLRMQGTVLNPADVHIPLAAGWNWVGYIPNYPLPINLALSSLTPQAGDLIKSQTAFAQFLGPDFGWIGNLINLSAPNGYQIKLAAPGTLTYPPAPQNKMVDGGWLTVDGRGNDPISGYWTIDPTQFEYSTTLIGMLKINDLNATTATMELGAFAGNELRGAAQAIFVEPFQAYVFFLTAYSNTSGEPLHFKLFDSSSGQIQDMAEMLTFSPDQHQGSLAAPVPFTLKSTATANPETHSTFDVQPNPFRSETMFRFNLPKAEEVVLSISSVGGQTLLRARMAGFAGMNTFIWKGETDAGERLAPGVYFARLSTEAGSMVLKVVVE